MEGIFVSRCFLLLTTTMSNHLDLVPSNVLDSMPCQILEWHFTLLAMIHGAILVGKIAGVTPSVSPLKSILPSTEQNRSRIRHTIKGSLRRYRERTHRCRCYQKCAQHQQRASCCGKPQCLVLALLFWLTSKRQGCIHPYTQAICRCWSCLVERPYRRDHRALHNAGGRLCETWCVVCFLLFVA
jgi:hypothetical protein